MAFSLNPPAPPPRPNVTMALRLLAYLLRRAAVLVAVIAVQQRRWLRAWQRLPWQLQGTCRSCGSCCENLLLPVPQQGGVVRALRRYWHEVVFDFYPRGFALQQGGVEYASYGCRNFNTQRQCDRYSLRPFVCRAYPALSLFDEPIIKQHCGYDLVSLPSKHKRKSARMLSRPRSPRRR